MSTGASLLSALLILALNGFFVGAEFAVMSARRSQIEPLADAGSKRAKTTLWAFENVSRMLACAQLGITVCTLALGALAEPTLHHLIEPLLHAVHVPTDLGDAIALVLALLIVSYLHVVVGEMVPKNIAISVPDRTALILAPPLVWIARALRPIVAALNGLADLGLWILRVEPRDEVASTFTLDEIGSIVEESQREGLLDDSQGLLSAAFEFSDRVAALVMVRPEVLVQLPDAATPADVEEAVTRTGFSRFPIARDGVLVGYVHVKDVLDLAGDRRHQPLPSRRIRAFDTASPADQIEAVLRSMQSVGAHLSRVDDADGTLVGIVFLEDVIEELVGEVVDATRRR
jgi:CBS domain containing-hemolysin-like protein